MIVGGVRILGPTAGNRHGAGPASSVLIEPTALLTSKEDLTPPPVPQAGEVTQDKRKWYQRPSRAERAENRGRMLDESIEAAMWGGSIAWMLLNPNKFAIASKIIMMFGVGTAGGGGVNTGKDYTDYDPQGA